MIVIGCGKSKLDRRAPAGELYTGSLFRAARRYAEARGGRWAILSARHGLVMPDEELEPYDDVLRLSGVELERWAGRAAHRLLRLDPELVEVLAGVTYARPLSRELGRAGVRACEPLSGLGMGRRLAWLSRATTALREAS